MSSLASAIQAAAALNGWRSIYNTNRCFALLTGARYISKKTYPWPELLDSDLEEKQMRGSGPGGQAVAKTSNCIQIKHIPTGIVVKNHETRSTALNRQRARENLIYQLDIHYNKDKSFDAIDRRETSQKHNKADSKAKKLRQLKKDFKVREGLIDKQGMTSSEESEGFIVKKDWYGGLVLDTALQTFDTTEEYDDKLTVALPKWQLENIRGFWAKVSLKQAHLAGVFAKHGLDFHHAQSGYVMMARWLPTSEVSMIPEFANQYLGVAGFVVNEDNKLLVIQEKYHPGTATARWKLPGGHADKGEEIADTAVREVLEETGIQTEFRGIITFRHQLNYRYNCADFYFICLLRPAAGNQAIRTCEREIAACKWVDIDEYLNNPDISDANRYFTQCFKDGVIQGNMIIGATPVPSYNKKSIHNIYSIQKLCKSDEESS